MTAMPGSAPPILRGRAAERAGGARTATGSRRRRTSTVRSTWARNLAVPAAAVAFGVLLADPASACAVCYGDSDSAMARGADLSILFMAVLTYSLIVGGGAAFFFTRLRARRRSPDTTREAAGGETGSRTGRASRGAEPTPAG